MKQERISLCENPNYGKFSLQTLKQLAATFDVALIVRLAPFSEVVEWELSLSPESLEVENFDKEEYFKEKELSLSFLKEKYSQETAKQAQKESNLFQLFNIGQIDQKPSATQARRAS